MATKPGIRQRVARAVARAIGGPSLAGGRSSVPVRAQALAPGKVGGRRLGNWTGLTSEINTLLMWHGSTLIARARELVATNPYAVNGREAWIAALIGTGIRPSFQDQAVRDLWQRWCWKADADGSTNLYGLESQIAGALFDAGECFIRLRPRRPSDGLPVPLQLQLLEADFLDRTFTSTLNNGNRIRSGIEFDAIGRRVAYHFWPEHPGDATILNRQGQRKRIPAEQVLHVFQQVRPGQIRGWPRIVPAMIRLHLLDEYDDAELDRQKVSALVAGFVTQTDRDPGVPGLLGAEETDADGIAEAEWEPGSLVTLDPGEEVSFSTPAGVAGTYELFQYRTLLAVCAAMGLPYTHVTGDLFKATYSSARMELVQLRRRVSPIQLQTLIPQFCRPVVEAWVQAAALAGAIPTGSAEGLVEGCTYILPKWEHVDPEKDRRAEKLAVDEGWKSRDDVIESEGGDPVEVDNRRKASADREEALGLSHGSPPAATQGSADQGTEDPNQDTAWRIPG